VIHARAAAWLAAVWLGLVPVCAFARAPLPAMQIVPGSQMAAVAERSARAAVPDTNLALVAACTLVDQSLPTGAVALVPGTPQVNATYVSVPIAIDIDGVLVRTLYAGYRITTYVRMPVAAHDLAPGAVLGADDLSYARLPFGGRTGLDIDTFVGRKMRSAVARGDVLYPELTAVNEIVRAGMPALFIVHDGPVRLAADVIARTSGGLGDYVTIFDPQTQRALSGVVTGPNTVELTVPGAN
jgi:flagella basal body P-ring formation protein FlgA